MKHEFKHAKAPVEGVILTLTKSEFALLVHALSNYGDGTDRGRSWDLHKLTSDILAIYGEMNEA